MVGKMKKKRTQMTTEFSSKARDLINQKLEETGKTVAFICRKSDMFDGHVYNYLNGRTDRVAFETVARIMSVLKIPMGDVFGEPKKRPSDLPKGRAR